MSVSKVDIVNLAMIHLGADTITSLTDDTKEARQASVAYDIVRRSLLRAHPWNFAMKGQTLSLLVDTPPFKYNYKYSLPTDCLRALKMYNSNYEWDINGKYLETNQSGVNLIYIADIEDTTYFDSTFVELFALTLANTLAYSISGSSQLDQIKLDRMNTLKKEAKQWDGQEGTPPRWDQTDWLDYFDLGT